MVVDVVIARHGTRTDKVDPAWLSQTATPWDPPLHESGFPNVCELVAKLAASDLEEPVVVMCSPFLRCVQTALPIANALNAKLRLSCAFGEWMTPDYFEMGAPPEDNLVSVVECSYSWIMREAKDSIPIVDFTWDVGKYGESGKYGEEWEEMHQRVAHHALPAALSDCANEGTLVIVTHGAVCNSVLSELRGVPQVELIPEASCEILRLECIRLVGQSFS